MNTRIRRNIIATLLRAKRPDLANVVAGSDATAWDSGDWAPEEEDTPSRPEEDDFMIEDKYTGVDVGQKGGKFLGHFKDDQEALKAIFKKMERDKFFPNIWHISDHGNVDLMIVKKKGGKFDWTYGSTRTTAAYQATKEIKQLTAANAAIGKQNRTLDTHTNSLIEELQTPLSYENFNRADRKIREVDTYAKTVSKEIEGLRSVLKSLQEEIQLQRGKGG